MERKLNILLVVLALLSCHLLKADSQQQFEKHKIEILKKPELLRYYTFEEGYGEEVKNLAKTDPERKAMSGGPIGSLYILRNTPYGISRAGYKFKSDDGVPSPEWTEGRWPWKSALTNGLERRCVFRSGFNGKGVNSFTIEAWIRIHKMPKKNPGCSLFNIGQGNASGLIAAYKNGRIRFTVVSTTGRKTVAAPITEGTWHQLVCGFGDGKVELFIDGKLAASAAYDGDYVATQDRMFKYSAFIESRGDYLQVGGRPASFCCEGRFDIGELAVFKGLLTPQEVERQYQSGKPASSEAEQLATFKKLRGRTERLEKITVEIPKETWGYFEHGKDIPITVTVPKESVSGVACDVVLTLTNLAGKKVWEKTHEFSFGNNSDSVWKTSVTPKMNDVYFLDAVFKNKTGDIIKRLPEPYCIGVTPALPEELSSNNPISRMADLHPWSHGMGLELQFADWADVKTLRQCYEENKKAGKPYFPLYLLAFRNDLEDWHHKIGPKEEQLIREKVTKYAEGLKDIAHAWVVGGENNGKTPPETFLKLLKICSEVLREKSPGVPIVAPNVSPSGMPFVKSIMRDGAWKYFDILSFHDYQAFPIHAHNWSGIIDKLNAISMEYAGKKLPIWNSENGYFRLPRIGRKPMTFDDARRIGYKVGSNDNGHLVVFTSMGTAPEETAAARQVQHFLLGLAEGYGVQVKCQGPCLAATEGVNSNAVPNLMGIALTQLSTVLDPMKRVEELPLTSMNDACVIVTDKNDERTAILFSDESPELYFHVRPNQPYKGVDMLGNPLTFKSDEAGLLKLKLTENPIYLSNIPADFKQAAIVKIDGPKELPDNNVFSGTVTVSNPFAKTLHGKLDFIPLPGAQITLSRDEITLAPGKSEIVPFTLKAERLKRKRYAITCKLKNDTDTVGAGTFMFTSKGSLFKVGKVDQPITLDGDDAEWKNVPEDHVRGEENIVRGKPNIAETWLPQWRGPEDTSFSIQSVWRENDGIYLLIKVKDNIVMTAPPEKRNRAFQWDCLEMYVDGRPDGQRHGPVTLGADQVIVIPQVKDKVETCDLWYKHKDDARIKVDFVGKRTQDGYIMEGKITPKAGSSIKLEPGTKFSMDLTIDDRDANDSPDGLKKVNPKVIMALNGMRWNYVNTDAWSRFQLDGKNE